MTDDVPVPDDDESLEAEIARQERLSAYPRARPELDPATEAVLRRILGEPDGGGATP